MSDRRSKEWDALRHAFYDYEGLRKHHGKELGLPELKLVAVEYCSKELDATEAKKELEGGLKKGPGWARMQSGLVWSGQALPEDLGLPLFAEWLDEQGKSWRLQALPGAPYKARLSRFSWFPLSQDAEPGGRAVPALLESRSLLAEHAPDGVALLQYHICWGAEPHDDVHALRRRFHFFAGFA